MRIRNVLGQAIEFSPEQLRPIRSVRANTGAYLMTFRVKTIARGYAGAWFDYRGIQIGDGYWEATEARLLVAMALAGAPDAHTPEPCFEV